MSRTRATLVGGARAGAREVAIAALLAPGEDSVVLLEGMPDGTERFGPGALAPGVAPPAVHRISAGCLCCSGQLVLRVTLNRILRHPPARLFLALADPAHLASLRDWLSAPPYDALLALTPDLIV